MPSLNLIVSCPYDRTHRIAKSVLPYHLLRCRKNHPPTKVQCPFNTLHVVNNASFEGHVLNCESSGNIKSALYAFGPQRQLGTVSLETVKNLSAPVMKDWEEENVPTYDPWQNTENRNIIRYLMCTSKSKRKQFKLAERRRIQRLEKNGTCTSNLKTSFKFETLKKRVNISQLITNLKRLNLLDIDSLIETIDMSKLMLNDIGQKSTCKDCKYIPEVTEEVLIQKFCKLMLYCLNT